MKKLLFSLSFLAMATCVMAQSGTNSPYSLFGLGKLADQSVGASRGMNGVGLAFRDHNTVNSLNPASYSAIDSLTFIFDIGLSLQNTNFKEYDTTTKGYVSKNAKNADFEYAIALFRVVKHLGVSFGFLPYTNVGYDFTYTSPVISNYVMAPATKAETTQIQSYKSGGATYTSNCGLHEAFIGAGWATPIKGLSIGANVGYMWGNINRYNITSYTDAYARDLERQYTYSARSYKLDFGLQYERQLNSKYSGSIGLTYSPGHGFHDEAQCCLITTSTSVNDTTVAKANNAYSLPTEIGVGFGLNHGRKWKVGLDYKFQAWGNIHAENYVVTSEGETYGSVIGRTDSYVNRHCIKAGGEFCVNEMSRDFIDRLRYRFGVGYSSPYQKINGHDGPRELSVSCGVGVPIMNAYNNRSVVNIGFTWQNYKAPNFITENTLLINVGITFNERWFAKWKFE